MPIAPRTASMECRPGECWSASVSSSLAANTDWRSSRCRIDRHAISSAVGTGGSTVRPRERLALGTSGNAIARSAQISRSMPCSGSALGLRVASAAICASASPRSQPFSSIKARIAFLRVENASRNASCRSPRSRSSAAAPPSPAPPNSPVRSGGATARCGSRPRSAAHGGAARSARCSSTGPQHPASCWPPRHGCAAAGRGRGSRHAGTAPPQARAPSRADAGGSPGPSPVSPASSPRSSPAPPSPPRHGSAAPPGRRADAAAVGSSAASDTDFGAEKVMSKPGRCSCWPSRLRPRRMSVPGT